MSAGHTASVAVVVIIYYCLLGLIPDCAIACRSSMPAEAMKFRDFRQGPPDLDIFDEQSQNCGHFFIVVK